MYISICVGLFASFSLLCKGGSKSVLFCNQILSKKAPNLKESIHRNVLHPSNCHQLLNLNAWMMALIVLCWKWHKYGKNTFLLLMTMSASSPSNLSPFTWRWLTCIQIRNGTATACVHQKSWLSGRRVAITTLMAMVLLWHSAAAPLCISHIKLVTVQCHCNVKREKGEESFGIKEGKKKFKLHFEPPPPQVFDQLSSKKVFLYRKLRNRLETGSDFLTCLWQIWVWRLWFFPSLFGWPGHLVFCLEPRQHR